MAGIISGAADAAFTYSALEPVAAAMAKEHAREIKIAHRAVLSNVIDSGRRLKAVKDALGHGPFGKWIDAEFGWKERTAQNYILAAETYGSNPQCVADLPLNVLYRLQAPSVPSELRQEILVQREKGDTITAAEIDRRLSDDASQRRYQKLVTRKSSRRRRAPVDLAAEARRQKRMEAEQRKADAERAKALEKARVSIRFLRERLGDDMQHFVALLKESDIWDVRRMLFDGEDV